MAREKEYVNANRTCGDIARTTGVSLSLVITNVAARMRVPHLPVPNARKSAFLHEVAQLYRA